MSFPLLLLQSRLKRLFLSLFVVEVKSNQIFEHHKHKRLLSQIKPNKRDSSRPSGSLSSPERRQTSSVSTSQLHCLKCSYRHSRQTWPRVKVKRLLHSSPSNIPSFLLFHPSAGLIYQTWTDVLINHINQTQCPVKDLICQVKMLKNGNFKESEKNSLFKSTKQQRYINLRFLNLELWS